MKSEVRTRYGLAVLAGFAVCFLSGCGPSAQDQKVIERLRSPNVAIRMKAIPDAEAKPNRFLKSELLRMFDDPRELPFVQGAAGMAVARTRDPRILDRLSARLPQAAAKGAQPGPFANAELYMLGRTLGAYGPGSLPVLGTLLQHPKPEVVAWAVQQYGSFRHNDTALKALSHYIADKDVRLRRAAAAGLAHLYHPGAETIILAHLGDPDPEVRSQLASALANYGTPQSLPELQKQAAKEKDPQVKRSLAIAQAGIQSQALAGVPAASASKKQPIVKR